LCPSLAIGEIACLRCRLIIGLWLQQGQKSEGLQCKMCNTAKNVDGWPDKSIPRVVVVLQIHQGRRRRGQGRQHVTCPLRTL